MTILIKGMEMPKTCADCWALDDSGDYPYCLITQEQRGYTFRTREQRMGKCPLVEVPTPHGRLIDANAIPFVESEDGCPDDYAYRYDINELPTVIEAEVEE